MFKRDLNVLVVGCGGLGCELVKALILSGFKRISVVDHDKVTLSNLNRQFLFRSCDVDKFKAQAVCEFLSNYADTTKVTTKAVAGGSGSSTVESAVSATEISCYGGNTGLPHVSSEGCRSAPANTVGGDTGVTDGGTAITSSCYCCKIQQLDLETLAQFDVVLAALDSVTARRWLNWALFQIVAPGPSPRGPVNSDLRSTANPSDCDPVAGDHARGSGVLLIDGGSQALYGHVRVVEPFRTPCIECTLGMFSPESPPPCVITNITTAEHCVYHALNTQLDSSPDERAGGTQPPELLLERVYELSRSLAEANKVEGLTRDLVDRICNRSVPNVATTNAVIAALMVNLLMRRFDSGPGTDNFYFYTGDGSTALSSFTLEPDKSCTVCASRCAALSLSPHTTLNELLSLLSQLTHSQDLNVLSDEVNIDSIKKLSRDKNTVIVLISSRTVSVMDEWFHSLPNVGLCAERGYHFKLPSVFGHEWQTINETSYANLSKVGATVNSDEGDPSDNWRVVAIQLFEQYVQRTPGSCLESKDSCVVFQFQNSDQEFGMLQANELNSALSVLMEGFPVDIHRGKGFLEVRLKGVNKGNSLLHVVNKYSSIYGDFDFILCLGDDKSDEESFRALEALKRSHPPTQLQSPQSKHVASGKLDGSVHLTPAQFHQQAQNQQKFPEKFKRPDSNKQSGTPTMSTDSDQGSVEKNAIKDSYISCIVGKRPSKANYYLNDYLEVANLLSSLANHMD